MSAAPRAPLSELEIVQNPTLGAFALWQVGLAFQEEGSSPLPLPLAFLVLPLVFHRPTLEAILSTRKASGLSLFAAKLGNEREKLLAVHERALLLRWLTLQSIGVGVTARLLRVDHNEATLRAYALEPGVKRPPLPERLKGFATATEKLGFWFYKAGLVQSTAVLRIEF